MTFDVAVRAGFEPPQSGHNAAMMITLRRTAALIVVPAALTLALTACGAGGRPSANDIATSLKKAEPSFTTKQAQCFGTALNASSLSDSKLKELMAANSASDVSDFTASDKAAAVAALKSAATCMGVDPSKVPTSFNNLF